MRIADASFVVTDTETTGMRAGEDRLIEIAAVRVANGMIVDRFQQLINPECPVPGRIARLTGISTSMVADQPTACDVLPDFLSFLGDGVFVAHNLSFDLRFVNAELRAAARAELPCETLCTLRLARRLLPGLRSKSLASICDFYRIRNRQAHRALADAEATAEILIRFLEKLEREHRIASLEGLMSFQHRVYRSASRSRHIARIKQTVLPELPSEPGVYFMKDAGGNTVYVGKARDLRARVSSYFTAIEGHPPRLRKMVDVVRDVAWQVAESELDAMIRESRLIKELQPRFNRAQRKYQVRPFLRLSTDSAYPTINVVPVLHHDGGRYFGPFENRESADRIAATIDQFFLLRTCSDEEFARGIPCEQARLGRCAAPCGGFVTEGVYSEEVARVERFLDGADADILETIRKTMQRAAVAMKYEEAAALRDRLQTIERLLERDGCVAPSVMDQNAILAHLGSEEDQDHGLRLHLIRHGRLQESLRLSIDLPTRDRAELVRCLGRCFHPDIGSPDRYYVEETDEVRLIRQWAYTNRNQIERVTWEDGVPTDLLLNRVVEAVRRLSVAAA